MRVAFLTGAILLLAAGPAPAADGAFTAADLARIRDAIRPCWEGPGADAPASRPVTVDVWLDGDGGVERAVVAGATRGDADREELEDRARRAVLRCQPYPMPAGHREPLHLRVMLMPE